MSIHVVFKMFLEAESFWTKCAFEWPFLVSLVFGVDVVPHRVFASHPTTLVALQGRSFLLSKSW